MTYFRRFICRRLGHTYVVRRFRRYRRIIGWKECLVCGYQPAAIPWRNVQTGTKLPTPLCYSNELPRILGIVSLEEVD